MLHHIFTNAKGTSNEIVRRQIEPFLGSFYHFLSHRVILIVQSVLALITNEIEASWGNFSGANTRNKTVHTSCMATKKGPANWFFCTIFFEIKRAFWKMWHGCYCGNPFGHCANLSKIRSDNFAGHLHFFAQWHNQYKKAHNTISKPEKARCIFPNASLGFHMQ